jgi:membrane protease YdiL (CAAX protease family)
LRISKKSSSFRAIDTRAPKQADNPYRQILRRHVPEPLLALLIFVMGVWLWNNHFGGAIAYDRGDGRVALLKIDRDLRLAEATGHLPPLLLWALAVEDREAVLRRGVRSLDALAVEGALDEDGLYAMLILDAIERGRNPAEGAFAGLPGPPDTEALIRRIAAGDDPWWDREYLRCYGLLNQRDPQVQTSLGEDPRNERLARRTIMARGAVWLLGLAGLGFLPRTLSMFGRALRSRERGYIHSWPVALGLGVFLMAYLASIGFGRTIDLLISGNLDGEGGDPVALPPWLFALLDAATRFLPPLVAMGFLFRRSRHAVGRLGLAARPDLGLVLGTFALLGVIDLLLKHTLGASAAPNPTGGLSASDTGFWGLYLMVSSACIAAPIAEEILYRGVLFRSLANGLRVPAATFVSAVVFAIVHFYTAYGLVSVGIFGAACALNYAATGGLTTAIALHVLYNSAIKIPEWIVYHAPL